MNGSQQIRRLVVMLAYLLIIFLPSRQAAAGDLQTDLKNILEIYDTEFLAAFDLELAATFPTHMDAHRGVCQATIHLAGDREGQYLELEKTAIEPVKFDRQDINKSFDPQGNNLFGYDKRLAIHLGSADWRVLREPELYTVDPASQLAAPPRMAPSRLEIFPAGHPDAANLYYRYLLGLGRGYAQLLDEVTSVTLDERGLATVLAKGRLFSPHAGQWRLEVDTTADYLVKRARFTTDGADAPCFQSEAVRVHPDTIPLYAEGVVTLADYTIKVYLRKLTLPGVVTTLAPADGTIATSTPVASDGSTTASTLARRVVDKVRSESLLPEQSTIMDFRAIDGDGMPLIRKKKAGV